MSKSRYRNIFQNIGIYYDWVFGGLNQNGVHDRILHEYRGTQLVNQSNKRENGKFLPGGDWKAWYSEKFSASNKLTVIRPHYGRAYSGQSFDENITVPYEELVTRFDPAFFDELFDELALLGAEGYARARPAKPDFSAATSLLELKDVPGMLRQAISVPRNAVRDYSNRLRLRDVALPRNKIGKRHLISQTAQWYLALSFGWLPIVKGIQDFLIAQNAGQEALKQLLRDEGRPIRRKRFFKDLEVTESSTQTQVLDTPYVPDVHPILVTQCYAEGYKATVTTETSVRSKTWFAAKFKYWLPPGPRDVVWTKKMRNRLLGSRITPDVAWNLMPWTFLIDYFATLNSAISNLGPGVEEQLYTQYCYVCRKIDWTVTRTVTQFVHTPDGVREWVTVSKHNYGIRARISADPFAFRFRGGGPTLKQTAILLALASK